MQDETSRARFRILRDQARYLDALHPEREDAWQALIEQLEAQADDQNGTLVEDLDFTDLAAAALNAEAHATALVWAVVCGPCAAHSCNGKG